MKKSYAKISLPSITKIYKRKRLFEILDNNRCFSRGKLATFISAPPGTGKTTLVTSYIKARNIQHLWYQLDDGDDDPGTFFYYMGLALLSSSAKKNNHLAQPDPEYSLASNTFCKQYFQKIYHQLSNPFVLVFDNFQEISESSPLHDLLSNICSEIPEHGHVIFISRQRAPPALARLLVHKKISALGWQDLRFTPQETQAFLQLQGQPVSSTKELNKIDTLTEGWAVGLLNLQDIASGTDALKISHARFPVSGCTLFDYFAWEVFKNFNEDEQEILLQGAFLPTMTTNTLQDLTRRSDASKTLESMCQENYFTVRLRPDNSGVVSYQYHPMFREFLLNRSHAHFSDKKIQSIKQTAADLLEKEGKIEGALSLFAEFKDLGEMTRLIIQYAPLYMSQGRYKTIRQWLEKMPEETLNSNPWLLYWSGISHLRVNPVASQIFIEHAYKIFQSNSEPTALWLSWSGVVDSIFIAFSDFSQFDSWIKQLDQATIGPIPFFKVIAHIIYAHALIENAEHAAAEIQISSAMSIADDIQNNMQNNMALFMCNLLKAHHSLVRSRQAEALQFLRQALKIGRKNNYKGTFDWRASVMTKLCHMALVNKIDVSYVQSLIRTNRLEPEHSCCITTKYWPCPLRIYTLGRFTVEKQGELVKFSGKTQRKPMEFLKVLIALGGRSISEKQLADILWPEAEGDAAQQALATTLCRLRKLISEPNSTHHCIIRQDKTITLDAHHCWVDCWEFERLLNHKDNNKDTAKILNRVRELYQTPFLNTEEIPWAFSLREKLHHKFIRTISHHAEQLMTAGRHNQALELYQWGLEVDDLVEDFYTGLMGSLIALGKHSDAISVFQRCQKVFSSKRGIEPSVKTKRLYQGLFTQPE